MNNGNIKRITDEEKLISEKFDFIINKYIKSATEISNTFGFAGPSKISGFRSKSRKDNLLIVHMESLEKHFHIPVEVFDKNIPIEDISKMIEEYRDDKFAKQLGQDRLNNILNNMFNNTNKIIFDKLQGIFYAHMYPSNQYGGSIKDGVSITETIINDDYSVIDEYGNKGILRIGQYQSFIFKVSRDEKDINVIRFHNRDLMYGDFRYVILSNQNGTTNETVNFGFYSRKKHTPKEVKRILGDDISKLQLKLDLEFNARIG